MSKNNRNKSISSYSPSKPQTQTAVHSLEMYKGILPRPRDFAEFESVLPGCAVRIVSMAEKEQ